MSKRRYIYLNEDQISLSKVNKDIRPGGAANSAYDRATSELKQQAAATIQSGKDMYEAAQKNRKRFGGMREDDDEMVDDFESRQLGNDEDEATAKIAVGRDMLDRSDASIVDNKSKDEVKVRPEDIKTERPLDEFVNMYRIIAERNRF